MSTAGTSNAHTSQLSSKFVLSPHQQDLLFAALSSNSVNPSSNAESNTLSESPTQAPGSGNMNVGVEESPFIDYDYDFDQDGSSFDFGDFANTSPGQMIGRLPGTSSSDGDAGEIHEKRSHPDEDDENDEEGGGKRREGDEKSSRKPGRKPLTSEPTSKRKAQNRAAQRAFRERKEKHLKDMETKIQDLEKASESANHENAILRAKVEKMALELKEYRKKLSLSGSASRSPTTVLPPYMVGKGFGTALNNPNDVNFQFDFPQFGKLPCPPMLDASSSVIPNPPEPHQDSTGDSISPMDNSMQNTNAFTSFASNAGMNFDNIAAGHAGNGISEFSDLFPPSILDSVGNDFSFDSQATVHSNASRSSSDSARGTGNSTSYNSPSVSSHSAASHNNGSSSSCGTSPEPSGQSPAKGVDTMDTIGEDKATDPRNPGEESFCEKLGMACGNPNQPIPRTMSESGVPSSYDQYKTGMGPGIEFGNFDWYAQQNVAAFDPELFGDYREPQNNILAGNGLFDDSFFSDALNMDQFNSPIGAEISPHPAKKDLVAQIDDKLNAEEEVVPGEEKGQMLTCNNMWEKIQNCPSVQNGEVDMDQLCTQLQQKAKCSGEGPVIDEKDFKSVIKSMFPADKPCPIAK